MMQPWRVVLAGLLALGVAMGIGRFAFTPLLPMMLADGALDLSTASWLASANYFGYLLGALLCTFQPWIWRRLGGLPAPNPPLLVRGGLVATALLTLGMALQLQPLSLAPGFNRVTGAAEPFQPLQRFPSGSGSCRKGSSDTRLKPGANEIFTILVKQRDRTRSPLSSMGCGVQLPATHPRHSPLPRLHSLAPNSFATSAPGVPHLALKKLFVAI